MAVYTVLEKQEIEALIKPFGIGPLLDFQGVAEGLENTSYFISTDHSALRTEELSASKQDYVLTVFEELSMADLPFYVELTTALNRGGLKVPCPLSDYNGGSLQKVAEKPALLFPKISGHHPGSVSEQHCQAIGEALAKMHCVSQQLSLSSNKNKNYAGNRNSHWLKQTAEQVLTVLDAEEKALIKQALDPYWALIDEKPKLPTGIIHNDLFRDNTLFEGEQLNGIIDFYNACHGYLLVDLAIVVNDWCSTEDGGIDPARYNSLLDAYALIRPFTALEQTHWNTFLATSACRFWLSRLLSRHFPKSDHREGCLIPQKDPAEYRSILLHRLGHPKTLPRN